jgi:hypothetical protein
LLDFYFRLAATALRPSAGLVPTPAWKTALRPQAKPLSARQAQRPVLTLGFVFLMLLRVVKEPSGALLTPLLAGLDPACRPRNPFARAPLPGAAPRPLPPRRSPGDKSLLAPCPADARPACLRPGARRGLPSQ